jgi:hypothetical protein
VELKPILACQLLSSFPKKTEGFAEALNGLNYKGENEKRSHAKATVTVFPVQSLLSPCFSIANNITQKNGGN